MIDIDREIDPDWEKPAEGYNEGNYRKDKLRKLSEVNLLTIF